MILSPAAVWQFCRQLVETLEEPGQAWLHQMAARLLKDHLGLQMLQGRGICSVVAKIFDTAP